MEAAAAQLALLGTDTATLNREGIRTYLDIRAPRNGYVTNMDINAGNILQQAILSVMLSTKVSRCYS